MQLLNPLFRSGEREGEPKSCRQLYLALFGVYGCLFIVKRVTPCADALLDKHRTKSSFPAHLSMVPEGHRGRGGWGTLVGHKLN